MYQIMELLQKKKLNIIQCRWKSWCSTVWWIFLNSDFERIVPMDRVQTWANTPKQTTGYGTMHCK